MTKQEFSEFVDQLEMKVDIKANSHSHDVARGAAMAAPRTTPEPSAKIIKIRESIAAAKHGVQNHNPTVADWWKGMAVGLQKEFDQLDDIPVPHIGDID